MNFSEFKEFGDPEGWDEICISQDEYKIAEQIQRDKVDCSPPGMTFCDCWKERVRR